MEYIFHMFFEIIIFDKLAAVSFFVLLVWRRTLGSAREIRAESKRRNVVVAETPEFLPESPKSGMFAFGSAREIFAESKRQNTGSADSVFPIHRAKKKRRGL